jgi:hypothetical protein
MDGQGCRFQNQKTLIRRSAPMPGSGMQSDGADIHAQTIQQPELSIISVVSVCILRILVVDRTVIIIRYGFHSLVSLDFL